MRAAMRQLMQGSCDGELAAAFLMGLRVKGESGAEIAAAAGVLREHMVAFDAGQVNVLDTCGTGGDGSGTFNISTATALVMAGAGVAVVKHGNRSVSSKSGSADVLAELSVNIEGDLARTRRCLDEAGLAFCFAPTFHPAMKNVGPLRRKLGVPTIFNCLGPLANPARASRQLLGVGRLDLLDRMAEALQQLGTTRSLVVHALDGLDEVSLGAATLVREVSLAGIVEHRWTHADFGLPACSLEDLRVADVAGSARAIEEVLQNREGPATWVVQANAAAGLWLMGVVDDLRAGVAVAAEALRSGRARAVLDKLRQL